MARRLTRRDGAVGVDGVTAAGYGTDPGAGLPDLPDRIRSGSHGAPPARRRSIPRGDGRQRPPGIPALEDRVARRAAVTVPEPVRGADLLPCPYGLRPGRPAHGAPGGLREGLAVEGPRRVTGADAGSCPDRTGHRRLRDVPGPRAGDGVMRRVTGGWLEAGVPDPGVPQCPDTGTPRGGAVSPVLPDVFPRHVPDGWTMGTARPGVGAFRPARHADGLAVAFRSGGDGGRVPAVPGARPAGSGLSLHPAGTRVRGPAANGRWTWHAGPVRLSRPHPPLGQVTEGTPGRCGTGAGRAGTCRPGTDAGIPPA